NDAGTGWIVAVEGEGGVEGKSEGSGGWGATIDALAGNNLTLTVVVSFKAGFAGAKEIWLYGAGNTVNSGWQKLGDWTVPVPIGVSAVSVTPNAGSGSVQSFQLLYSDTLGAADLTTTWAWFTPAFSSVSAANTCLLYYDRVANRLNLLNDAGTGWIVA